MSQAAREHVLAVHGPGCMCILHQHERAVAARKGQPAGAASAPKIERLPQVSAAVTLNAGSTEASRKRGRPRVLSDEQRREKVRQRVAGWRAAKAGKAGAR